MQNPATASAASTIGWYIGLKPFAHPPIATVSIIGQV